jgi:hypothetical protein
MKTLAPTRRFEVEYSCIPHLSQIANAQLTELDIVNKDRRLIVRLGVEMNGPGYLA